MKQVKVLTFALMVLMGIGFTSCMESEEPTPQWGGPVEIVSSFGYTYFKDMSGIEIHPTAASLLRVEEQMKFKSGSTKMAYVLFTYSNEGNENIATTKELKNVNLTYAISLDGTVETVFAAGAPNDSIATAPIIGMNDVINVTSSNTVKEGFVLLHGRYLFTGLNYYMQKKGHSFTMIYYPEEQEDGKLKLHLRHSGISEGDNLPNTSIDAFAMGYPHAYLTSFDLGSLIDGSKTDVTIEVIADVNTRNNKLNDVDNTTKKTYTLDYKFEQ